MSEYVLKLYLAGQTPETARTLEQVQQTLATEGLDYDLEVIDVLADPGRAAADEILATPMLVRELPLPLRRLIGDLSNTQGVLVGLELEPGRDDTAGEDG